MFNVDIIQNGSHSKHHINILDELPAAAVMILHEVSNC